MIKKIFGLEDPLIEKINSKYGEGLGNDWKLSNLLGRISIISCFFMFISFILLLVIVGSGNGTDAGEGILYLIRTIVPIILLLLLMIAGISALGFSIINIKFAYKMKENNWAIGMIVLLLLANGLGVLVGFLYKYLKGNELKKL